MAQHVTMSAEFWKGYEYARQFAPTEPAEAETAMGEWVRAAATISERRGTLPWLSDAVADANTAFCLGASACIFISLPASPAT